MSFTYDTFLRPITSSDVNIQIVNNDNIVEYTVNPFSVVNSFSSNNLLKISLKSGNTISVPFSSTNESKSALLLFQEHLDILRLRVPNSINKQIENYIDSAITLRLVENPTSSKGSSGDRLGNVSFSTTWLYYCIQDYTTGSQDIWMRISCTQSTWESE